jgi:PAS domain S-box-containing protein
MMTQLGLQEITAATDLIDVLETVEVPIVVVRRDFTVGGFNRAAAGVLSLLPSHVGRTCRDIPTLSGVPRLEQECDEVMAGGMESRVDFRDGEKWFVVRISPYSIGTVLTFTNITAFRASTDQAIYEREFTKAILNTVADPLVVLSADQQIQSGNRAFYAMFGVSRDKTQGVPLYEMGNGTFGPLRAQLNEMFAGSYAFQPVEVDHVFTSDGERTLVLNAHPLSLPGHSERRILVTFQDITARKQAEAASVLRSEEELRRSEAFLAQVQQLSSTGGFYWWPATGKAVWTEQVYRIFDLDPAAPLTSESRQNRIHPDDLHAHREAIEQAIGEPRDFEYEVRLLMPDQSIKYIHSLAQPTRDADGNLLYVGAVQDVTQRRRVEEALGKLRSELAHVARISTLGTLTASIAHEVNQPLSGILTNASTCLRMLDADSPNVEGARETARRTIRDAHRASEVITRLRALFLKKSEAVESFDLNEATREVIALTRSELQRNRVLVKAELTDDLPPVTGDRVQLQQVIMNLLLNASDAMRSVDDRPRQAVITTARDESDGVRLTVEDTGVGLGRQAIEKIFEPFYTTKDDGMGIGLAVSRSIIESHCGRIWATPNDGPGATFSFSIPRSANGAHLKGA